MFAKDSARLRIEKNICQLSGIPFQKQETKVHKVQKASTIFVGDGLFRNMREKYLT